MPALGLRSRERPKCREIGPLRLINGSNNPAQERVFTRHTCALAAYIRNAYINPMVFVELTPFIAFRNEYWTDEDLQALQNCLLLSPDSGDLIRGGSGLRKIRWSAQGRGKRGGARVIYYWQVPMHRIYLIYG